MNGKNQLAPHTDMNFSDEELEKTRISISHGTPDASMAEAMRKNVEARKKQLSVIIDESKLYSSERLARTLAALDDVLLDEEVIAAVKDGIINSKDPAKSYNEFAKASAEIYNRMMKQQLSSANPEAPQNAASGKSIKIGIFDKSGAVMVDIGGG